MAFVTANYLAPGGYQFSEQREVEPSLGDIVMIGTDEFVVGAVLVPDYWSDYGDVNQYRTAQVVLAYKAPEAK
ncbi:hypothetical protein GIW54_16955 [Pseudomonas proteolytica]|uniref:Uncharacterized protein n=1 Tax=Pseudomonas proteolytica TaxID=219574 RepID=A0AAW5AFK5_9PSED|nr:hypothetical protein [Pseudomonas proteolytica]MCF5059908.1 hypothetical protein [Pseudomonas proteolytica]MCF5102423.1 hypothetical protein [Pseudomonas proteolytica]